MRTTIYGILLTLFTAGFVSCDYLDKQPDDMLTLEQAFQTRTNVESYLASVFSYLPDEGDMMNGNIWGTASDEGTYPPGYTWHPSNRMKNGSYSALNPVYDVFGGYYTAIRSCNVFIENVDRCNELSVSEKTQFKAEAIFLRTFYHFLLMRQFGPIYYVNRAIPVDAELQELQLARNSMDELVEWLVRDLDEIINTKMLPDVIESTTYAAKPTRGAAMALKSRILLYAASPLFNGNTDYASMKNHDGKQLISQTEDRNKWKKAANAAFQLIETNIYSLYEETDKNDQLNPLASYTNLFLDAWNPRNKEVIFTRSEFDGWGWDRLSSPRSVGGADGFSPTQQQVDAYFMEDGLTIDESPLYSESGFSTEDGKYTKANTFNMYCHREPRFYASICYNGDEWVYDGNKVHITQFHFSGSDGMSGSHDYTPTGYLVRKMVSPATSLNPERRTYRPWIFFRLAEIYLNYAEAQNECEYSASTSYPDPLFFINLIRRRAGIPLYGTNAGDVPIPVNQQEMREAIRRERRVELAFETHRFFDTRRWKIAKDTDGGPMYGMNANVGTSATDPAYYVRTIFETRVFDTKHYLQPIKADEINRNPNCVQNIGW